MRIVNVVADVVVIVVVVICCRYCKHKQINKNFLKLWIDFEKGFKWKTPNKGKFFEWKTLVFDYLWRQNIEHRW